MKFPFVSRLAFEVLQAQLRASESWGDKMERHNERLSEDNRVLVDRIMEMKTGGFEKVDRQLIENAPVDEFGTYTEAAIEEYSGGDRALEDHLRGQCRVLLAREYEDEEIATMIAQGVRD